MPFLCYLCEKERVYTSYHCEDCRKIKNIMNVYGRKDVLSILETTCLRNQKQIGYKVNNIIKNENTTKKKIIDEKKPTEKLVDKQPTDDGAAEKPAINKESLRHKKKK